MNSSPVLSTNPSVLQNPGSFRDPSGFVFIRSGEIYRQVNCSYREHFDHLMSSGLYDELVERELLIPHEEIDVEPAEPGRVYKILSPRPVHFISYPYEWSFSELKDAALLTLEIERRALERGMSLKDASAFNVQFEKGKPVHIDTLSFELYQEGAPWVAYRQFCQHFLAPLALMSYVDVRLLALFRPYLDGIPLDVASKLLPLKSRFNFGLTAHLHLHALALKHYSSRRNASFTISRTALLGLLDNLESTVRGLVWRPAGTAWHDYYAHPPYQPSAMEQKERLVAGMLELITPRPAVVWDLGANTGRFSRLTSRNGITTISFDIDPGAVEKNYLEIRSEGESNLLPLVIDLSNPSPGLGWENRERSSLIDRGNADALLVLALIHHLAIGSNLPLNKIAHFLSLLTDWLIIEFVPKQDSQVQKLLSGRRDIFADYDDQTFESAFSSYFEIQQRRNIPGSPRSLYLMRRIWR